MELCSQEFCDAHDRAAEGKKSRPQAEEMLLFLFLLLLLLLLSIPYCYWFSRQ
jgi:hypothetical protein